MKLNVVKLREARGWSQAEFARRLAWTPQRLSNYEGENARGIGMNTLHVFAEVLGVTPSQLLGENEQLEALLKANAEADTKKLKQEKPSKFETIGGINADLYLEAGLLAAKLAEEGKIPKDRARDIAREAVKDVERSGRGSVTEHLLLYIYEISH